MPTRRVLKAVGHNLLDSLRSGPFLTQDGSILTALAAAGHHAGASVVLLDLLSAAVTPPEAGTPEVMPFAMRAHDRLLELVGRVGLPQSALTAARLVVSLQPDSPAPALTSVTVQLTDDRGRTHAFACPVRWFTPQAPHLGGPPPLTAPPRIATPVTRLLEWLEQFLPRFG